jgi:hypothetical protein
VRTLILVACACLAGCALTPTIEPGTTTEAQIIATYGQPTRRWQDTGGITTLEYATQPSGISCFMVSIDEKGRVTNVRDALSDTNLARVEIGMTEAQVDHLLGLHRTAEFFPRLGETAWEWNIPNFGPGVAARFDVYFTDGRVVRTGRNTIYGGDSAFAIRPPAYLPCPRCEP